MKSVLKFLPVTFLFLFLVLLFTLSKLPEAKIQNYVEGTINSQLAPMGITLVAQGSEFSLWTGMKYTMKDVTVNFQRLGKSVDFQSIQVSPSLSALLTGKLGANALIKQGVGEIKTQVALKEPQFTVDFDAKDLNLAQLPAYSTGRLSASGSLTGNMTKLNELEGNIKLNISPLATEEITYSGIHVPTLKMSELKTSIQFTKGVGQFRVLQIGKKDEDVYLTGTGQVNLGTRLASSTLDLDVNFSFADSVKKAVPLLDAFLGAGKDGSGAYAYKIRGPLTGPLFPTPL